MDCVRLLFWASSHTLVTFVKAYTLGHGIVNPTSCISRLEVEIIIKILPRGIYKFPSIRDKRELGSAKILDLHIYKS